MVTFHPLIIRICTYKVLPLLSVVMQKSLCSYYECSANNQCAFCLFISVTFSLWEKNVFQPWSNSRRWIHSPVSPSPVQQASGTSAWSFGLSFQMFELCARINQKTRPAHILIFNPVYGLRWIMIMIILLKCSATN